MNYAPGPGGPPYGELLSSLPPEEKLAEARTARSRGQMKTTKNTPSAQETEVGEMT